VVESHIFSHDNVLERLVDFVHLLSDQDLILFKLLVEHRELFNLGHIQAIVLCMVHFEDKSNLLDSYLRIRSVFGSLLSDAVKDFLQIFTIETKVNVIVHV
jgi:hypothetical protein